ncbi:hypothetical protein [Deinococcus yavapaiensis]|uniref:Uncharacterized protein n=1 Tax=Deinococcus yavapaiensis KR-236 TaxID=694435 RepID=A0A318S4Z8_9DEIO|nr:hypothetical protein [Deinococcus yavapaiensis]PYE53157.1 hypothetical protein DES52_110141 [Deinococcus yavapaiensis KR-236]
MAQIKVYLHDDPNGAPREIEWRFPYPPSEGDTIVLDADDGDEGVYVVDGRSFTIPLPGSRLDDDTLYITATRAEIVDNPDEE